MFDQQLNHRLGPEDNSFLVYDTETTPMNIGAVSVLEGDIAFDRFVENIESKIHLIPRYQQLVVPSPFGVGRPTWEFDPSFDVRWHVRELVLEPPGTLDQLFAAAAHIHETRLDRKRPLWEIHLVRGMEGGNTGMISKVHHCIVDGVGGISLLMIILDPSPDAQPSGTAPKEYAPPPVPGAFARFNDALFDGLSEGLDTVTNIEERLLDVATGADGDWLRMMGASLRTALPYFLFPARKTPFNRPFSGRREITGLAAPLEEVNQIRAVTGGTINDVALTVLGGAVARYLEGHGEDVSDRIIRIFTPVNVRRANEMGTLGNKVSMLLVEVPAGEKDPLARLRSIEQRTAQLKKDHVSDGVGNLSNAVFAMPAPLSKALVDLGALPLDKMGNMVCTNVPGPRFPLYSIGHQMLSMYPIVPIAWEMGIGCAIASYDGTLYLGLTSDLGAAPDAHLLSDYLVDSYVELRDAAGVSGA
ncbi:MAG TPA: wax ester/triacylglycerol synthase family O-acyltransferase [Dehalococcoidia bacterium]|nr:wax ester/triacylglycerol synthase family O-acyltransferase [Dehalococcoidia bacterium]